MLHMCMFKIALHFILSLASSVAASYCQFKYFNCLVTSPVHVFVGQPACLLKDHFFYAVSENIATFYRPPLLPPPPPCTTPTFYGVYIFTWKILISMNGSIGIGT